MTGETNPGLQCLFAGKHALHVAKASLAVGLAAWQEKCYLQGTAVLTESSPLVTVQSLLKKTQRLLSSWLFLFPRLEDWVNIHVHIHVLRTQGLSIT